MSKSRTEYIYVAARLDTTDPQNLGDYSIGRKGCRPISDPQHRRFQHYHFDSRTGRLTNRSTLRSISRQSRTYRDCLAAVERLFSDDVESWMFTENMNTTLDD